MPPTRSEQFFCQGMQPATIIGGAKTTSVKRRPRSNQSVTFSAVVAVHQFQKVPDAGAIWYTQEEYATLKTHADQSLQKLDEGKLVESCSECLVGLAGMSPHGMRTKMQRNRDAMQAVLREQRYQRKFGIADASRVAEVYMDCCSDSNCKTEAAMSAMRLAAAVKCDDQYSTSSRPTAPLVATNKKSVTLRGFLESAGFRVSAGRR
jgi:hypothetical protein